MRPDVALNGDGDHEDAVGVEELLEVCAVGAVLIHDDGFGEPKRGEPGVLEGLEGRAWVPVVHALHDVEQGHVADNAEHQVAVAAVVVEVEEVDHELLPELAVILRGCLGGSHTRRLIPALADLGLERARPPKSKPAGRLSCR